MPSPVQSSTVIPMPSGDKDFEEKCVVLFCGLLDDPNVKTVGARGSAQQGLDLLGARKRDPAHPVGVQCKLKTKGGRLTETEVRREVEHALRVTPPLTEYYVVTTASDDTAMDLLAMQLRQEQAKLGRQIDIQIWGWETLQQKIRRDQAAIDAFDPGQSAATAKLLKLGAETHGLVHAQTTVIVEKIEELRATITTRPGDPAHGSPLEAHLDDQIDQYRDLINLGRPRTALDLLLQLEARLGTDGSVALRARVRANIGWARLRLGEDEAAGRLLLEAYELNPGEPKLIANRVLGLILTGDTVGAAAFAREALILDPGNAGVAAFLYQAATIAADPVDPAAVVPEALNDDLGVRVHRISYLRRMGDATGWRRLATEAYAAHPDDDTAARMAADAMLDEAFEQRAFERGPVFSPDKAALLRQGAAILAQLWEGVRKFENLEQEHLLTIGINLANAWRALGDAAQAEAISQQLLAAAPDHPDVLTTAIYIALDKDDAAPALAWVRRLPEGPVRALQELNVLARLEDWPGVIAAATDARRNLLPPEDQQAFDTLLYRARTASGAAGDIASATHALLEAWPTSIAALVIAADAVRRTDPGEGEALAARAAALLGADTPYGDRLMLAQLATLRQDVDTVIRCLDGYIRTDRHSEPLAALAWAFANAAPRPRTHAFFESLPADLLATSRYARLAGVAEAARGDLQVAEHHLRVAVKEDPSDLRAHLQLMSVLRRQNRADAASAHVLAIDESRQQGEPMDKMRLAHALRHEGEAARALALGYATARDHQRDADVAAAYPPLILMTAPAPEGFDRAGPAAEDFWFDLDGDGAPDVQGVIERPGDVGDNRYPPEHPLARAIIGKSKGEAVRLESGLAPPRTYVVRDLKHKYVWLLHEIMQSHATRFPESNNLISLQVQEGDVQPVLDMVRKLSEHDKLIAQTYLENPVPLAAVAAASRHSVIELAERMAAIDGRVSTCAGNEPERAQALRYTQRARKKGAVLDTLTAWTAFRLGLVEPLKTYFGRLVIARSTIDELLELRAKRALHRGQEYMTLGYEGEQAVREVQPPEETERVLGVFDTAIQALETHCEIMPVDGAEDLRLDNEIIDRFAAAEVLDPCHLARSEKLYLLSEDFHLRRLAAAYEAKAGGWLQVAARAMADAGVIGDADYCIATAQLAALRHGHVWLDLATLKGLRQLDDPRRDALFESSLAYIGGPSADMQSHIAVVLDFMQAALRGDIEPTGAGRAIDALITRLLKGRSEWREILFAMDHTLARRRRAIDTSPELARAYLYRWIKGHFLEQALLRSDDAPTGRQRGRRRRRGAASS